MRPAASGWEALPASTTELDLYSQPSQDELKRIAARFPLLQRLDISPNEEVLTHEDEPDELDFSADGIHFPVLSRLGLSCVGMKSIAFTEANTPLLEALSLSSVIGECCPFHLALPRLRSLFAEHTALGERSIDAGQFGLSLSRCPLLETLDSYKFRCLGGSNYAVLPSLVSLKLHRSECTEHLDILYAPRLRAVSLQAAYDLSDFKLRNLPDATLATVQPPVECPTSRLRPRCRRRPSSPPGDPDGTRAPSSAFPRAPPGRESAREACGGGGGGACYRTGRGGALA